MSKAKKRDAAQGPSPVTTFAPIFTADEVRDMESNYEAEWGYGRRITQMTLTRSSAQLIEGSASILSGDPDAFFEMVDRIAEYQKHLQGGIELAETALARLFVVAEHFADLERKTTAERTKENVNG